MIVFNGEDIEYAGFGDAFLDALRGLDSSLPIGMLLFVNRDGQCSIDVDHACIEASINVFNSEWEGKL